MYTAVRIDEKGAMNIGGKVIPMIQMLCNNCGYIAQFSPIILGLMKDN